MSSLEEYRRRADDLLRQATRTTDLNERSRLITEGTQWHMKALAASGPAQAPSPVDGMVIPFPTDLPEADGA